MAIVHRTEDRRLAILDYFVGDKEYFPGVKKIRYEGKESDNPLAFKFYDPKKLVGGKKMKDHLRFAVAYWHSFCNTGDDPFGPGTHRFPWTSGGMLCASRGPARCRLRVLHEARGRALLLPRSRHGSRGQLGRRVGEEPQTPRRARQGAAEGDRRQAPVGDEQPLQQSALHERRGDESGLPGRDPRGGSGQGGDRRDRRARRRELRLLGRARRLLHPCSTPT